MKKIAGLEESDITDEDIGLPIRVSTSMRKLYREMDPDLFGGMRNARLNKVIANQFSKAAGNVLHYFPLTKGEASVTGEIRGYGSRDYFYISAIRSSYIDVLIIQSGWKQPTKKGLDD